MTLLSDDEAEDFQAPDCDDDNIFFPGSDDELGFEETEVACEDPESDSDDLE